jgi:Holliday junction resolvase RusA-like endonuclease
MLIVIPGEPVGKGRPRFSRFGSGVRVHTPIKTSTWEYQTAATIRSLYDGPQITGPVLVSVRAIKSRPKRLRRDVDQDGPMWRCAKPDGDNVLKAVLDAMVLSEVIHDDVQAVDSCVLSLYAEKNGEPRVEIFFEPITEEF